MILPSREDSFGRAAGGRQRKTRVSREIGAECQNVREDLDAFVDRELEAQRQAAIEDHFKGCRPCLQLYRLVVGVKNRLRGSAQRPVVPAQLRVTVLQALDQEVGAVQPRRAWPRWMSWRLAPAAALAFVAIVAIVLVGIPPVQSHNFTEIAKEASQRLANGKTQPVMPGTKAYREGYQKTGLPQGPMPSLAALEYRPEGCCFGLSVEHPAAHYIYRNEQGQVISVVKWKRAGPRDKVEGEPLTHEGYEYRT
ncbi:MAG TPA: hypothetical protein ENN74_02185, partial [Firmicutes bacterium]|nr:hypothetical protein [Bacillota bacterium]